jgi:hypothetical protein
MRYRVAGCNPFSHILKQTSSWYILVPRRYLCSWKSQLCKGQKAQRGKHASHFQEAKIICLVMFDNRFTGRPPIKLAQNANIANDINVTLEILQMQPILPTVTQNHATQSKACKERHSRYKEHFQTRKCKQKGIPIYPQAFSGMRPMEKAAPVYVNKLHDRAGKICNTLKQSFSRSKMLAKAYKGNHRERKRLRSKFVRGQGHAT